MANRFLKGLTKRVEKRVRAGLNTVTERVVEFDEKGGVRGAAERMRVRTERQARKVAEALEDRGIHINIGRLVPPTEGYEKKLRKAYETIGVPYLSDMAVVKPAYRALMRTHHPDKHAGDADREREATEKSQRITIAYELIEAYHKR